MRLLTRAVAGVPALWFVALGIRRLWTLAAMRRPRLRPLALRANPAALEVDDRLWRGPVPTEAGYRELLAFGVDVIVDLRGEDVPDGRPAALTDAAVEWVPIAVDDGHFPTQVQFERFVAACDRADRAFVHCRGGEGRTGTLIGALQVRDGRSPAAAVTDALSIGSLRLAQSVFIASGGRAQATAEVVYRTVDMPTAWLIRTARRALRRPVGAG